MVSVVGGLYGLNLIPLWRPTRLTFFDINPTAVTYFRIIHRLFLTSDDVDHFLRRLTEGDYDAETESEEFVRENIRLKQQGCLPRSRGSTKRSYPESWKIAFDHFDLTQQILREVPLEIRTVPMESESFSRWIREQNNLWIYCLEHHAIPFLRPGIRRPDECRPAADHPSRTAPAPGPGAAERRARPGPFRDSAEGGAHRSVIAAILPSQLSESTHMANKIRIQTNAAPPALGTYSQAIRTGDLVFVTGQTGRRSGNRQVGRGTGGANSPRAREHRRHPERRGMLECRYRQGDAPAGRHQGFQGGGPDLCRLAARAWRDSGKARPDGLPGGGPPGRGPAHARRRGGLSRFKSLTCSEISR